MSNYKELTREQVKTELSRAIARRIAVTDTIKSIVRERQRTGKTVDRERWSRLLDEQSRARVTISRLEAALSEVGRPRRDAYRNEFVGVAKERLSPETFAEWRAEAIARVNKEFGAPVAGMGHPDELA